MATIQNAICSREYIIEKLVSNCNVYTEHQETLYFSDSAGPKLGLKFCMSNQFSSGADAAGLCPTLAVANTGCPPLQRTGSQPWKHSGNI